MRRSGSSSCMLRPKSDVDLAGKVSDGLSVTLINTQPLPTYSVERFYMLSEMEVNAHSTTFLWDIFDCDTTQDTAESSEASFDHAQSQQQPSRYSILYVLWRPDQVSSPRAFAEGTLAAAIQQCKSLMSEQGASSTAATTTASRTTPDFSPTRKGATPPCPQIYLVVDIGVLQQESNETNEMDEAARQRQFQVKVDKAERLARYVAQSQDFRSSVSGITVGITNHVRAAPGLEACLDAILFGQKERRRFRSKSLVGLVALHPNDLLGMQDETVTDAAQGVLQSRTCAEWNGNGDLQTFARRAHSAWCAANGVEQEKETSPTNRKSRRRGRNLLDGEFDIMDPLRLWMVIFFLGYVVSHVWMSYFAGGAVDS